MMKKRDWRTGASASNARLKARQVTRYRVNVDLRMFVNK